MAKIIIIEDDIQLSFFMRTVLEKDGYQVEITNTARDGLKKINNSLYDLLLLDLNLPDLQGEKVCQEIRKFSNIPIIVFSAQNQINEKVSLFAAGANDYIVKPVEVQELLARVNVYTKKNNHLKNHEKQTTFKYKDLIINTETREVYRREQIIYLSPKEFDILVYFIKNPNKSITKQQLFEDIWQENFNHFSDKKVINEQINKLRKKIHFESQEKLLHTIYGIGYILK